MKTVTRTGARSKARSKRTDLDYPILTKSIEVPTIAETAAGVNPPRLTLAEWVSETRALVSQLVPTAHHASLVISHEFSSGIPSTVIAVSKRPSPAAERPGHTPAADPAAAARQRIIAWLSRIAAECGTVSDQMSGDRYADALTPAERRRLNAILMNAWSDIQGGLPMAIPAELAADFEE